MSEQTEREQPAQEPGGDGAQGQPGPTREQIFAVIAGVPLPDGSGMQFQLRLGPGVAGPLDFCLMVAQMALGNAAKMRQQEQAAESPIQVPRIALPPSFDPRGGAPGPTRPGAVPRSRGKGRGR